MTIRTFLAIPLSSACVRRLADQADALYSWDPQGRILWPDSSSYHLTLCFLGDIELEQVAQLESQVKQALVSVPSFQVQLNAIGYLPVSSSLGVVAALAETAPSLLQLQQQLTELVAAAGIELDGVEFHPHITLGRLEADNMPRHDEPLCHTKAELDLLALADSVVLFQSLPGQSGSIYTPLFEVPLAAIGQTPEAPPLTDVGVL